MKILKDNEHELLVKKAANYDAVVSAIVENGAGISAEDITAQTILNAMEPKDEAVVDTTAEDELTDTVETLNAEIKTLTNRAEAAEARVAELEDVPAEEPVGGRAPASGEEGGVTLDEINTAVKSSKDFGTSIEKVRSIL